MVDIRQLNEGELDLYRSTRLAALKDAPYAFGSSYEREAEFTEEKWLERATSGWEGKSSICIVAVEGACGVGLAGGITNPSNPRIGHLVSMWGQEDHRGTDVASRLVAQVEVWAFARGFETLCLGVTENNERAQRFYEKLGYTDYDGCLEDEDCLIVLHKPLSVS